MAGDYARPVPAERTVGKRHIPYGRLRAALAPIKAVRKHIQRPHRPYQRVGNADVLYLGSAPAVVGADERNPLKGVFDNYVVYRAPAYAAAANPYPDAVARRLENASGNRHVLARSVCVFQAGGIRPHGYAVVLGRNRASAHNRPRARVYVYAVVVVPARIVFYRQSGRENVRTPVEEAGPKRGV